MMVTDNAALFLKDHNHLRILAMKLSICLAFFVALHFSAHSQADKLGVGDKLPDIVFKNSINFPNRVSSLSVFGGKWLILDFWYTRCASCIEAFPRLVKLQKKFPDKVQFVLVTDESVGLIRNFLRKRCELTGLDMPLPIVCSDTLLHKYFSFIFYPHFVWIDPNGIIRSVTYESAIKEENILTAIQHKPLNLPQKVDTSIMYSFYDPLFIHGNAGDGKQLLWSTMVTKYIPGIASTNMVYNYDSNKSVISAMNWPIKALYQIAFNDDVDQRRVLDNRTDFDVKDTAGYVWNLNGDLEYDNLYCYQAILPKMPYSMLKTIMQRDLPKYFGLNARMETKERLCWVLSAKDTLAFRSKGGDKIEKYDHASYTLTIRNLPFLDLRLGFTYSMLGQSPYPFVNEVQYTGNVDLILHDLKMNDPESINNALKKYGMRITLARRKVRVLVISRRQ